MKGVVFTGDRDAELRQFEKPSPGPHEIVIQMKASGFYGSDLHFYRQSKARRKGINVIAAHESCGVVESVGRDVHKAPQGDQVSVYHYRGYGYRLLGLKKASSLWTTHPPHILVRLALPDWKQKHLHSPDSPEAQENYNPALSVYSSVSRVAWAQLIAKVYEVNSLECAKCHSPMKIIAFITDPEEVKNDPGNQGLFAILFKAASLCRGGMSNSGRPARRVPLVKIFEILIKQQAGVLPMRSTTQAAYFNPFADLNPCRLKGRLHRF